MRLKSRLQQHGSAFLVEQAMLLVDCNLAQVHDQADKGEVVARDVHDLTGDEAEYHGTVLSVLAVHRHDEHAAIVAFEGFASILRELLRLPRITDIHGFVAPQRDTGGTGRELPSVR